MGFIRCLKKYAVFAGRARRSEYWQFMGLNVAIALGLHVLFAKYDLPGEIVVMAIYGALMFLPALSAGVRRFHDFGRGTIEFFLMWFLVILGSVLGPIANEAANPSNNVNRSSLPAIVCVASYGIVLLVGLWMLFLLARAGEKGANKYGEDPR